MQHGEAAVLGGRGGDQRVGERYAVIAVAALGQLEQSAHRCVCDGAVVAHDAQRVQFGFQVDVLSAGARGAAPPRGGVGNERSVGAQQIVCVHALGGGLLVAVKLLDALERIAVQPVGTTQPLGELRQPCGTLRVINWRGLDGRGGR